MNDALTNSTSITVHTHKNQFILVSAIFQSHIFIFIIVLFSESNPFFFLLNFFGGF